MAEQSSDFQKVAELNEELRELESQRDRLEEEWLSSAT
jgi:hypothetical protein